MRPTPSPRSLHPNHDGPSHMKCSLRYCGLLAPFNMQPARTWSRLQWARSDARILPPCCKNAHSNAHIPSGWINRCRPYYLPSSTSQTCPNTNMAVVKKTPIFNQGRASHAQSGRASGYPATLGSNWGKGAIWPGLKATRRGMYDGCPARCCAELTPQSTLTKGALHFAK